MAGPETLKAQEPAGQWLLLYIYKVSVINAVAVRNVVVVELMLVLVLEEWGCTVWPARRAL